MAQPQADADDVDESEEADGGLVVTRCQSAGVFEAIEAALDEVSQRVYHGVDRALDLAVPAHRDDRDTALRLDGLANAVRIIASVGDHDPWHRQVVGHHQIIAGVVGGLARCDLGSHGQAGAIDPEVYLGREATFRTAKILFRSPPFAPAA